MRAQAQQPNVPAITNRNAPFVPNGHTCYQRGDPTHIRKTCPRLTIVNNAPANQANPANQVARGQAFNITAKQAQANNEVVSGTFLVNNHSESILFDTRGR
jgi:hypothetical protein